MLAAMNMASLRVNLVADDSSAQFRDTGKGFRLQPRATAGTCRQGYEASG